MKTLNILYRLKRYGKWKPLTIQVSEDDAKDRDKVADAINKEVGETVREFRYS